MAKVGVVRIVHRFGTALRIPKRNVRVSAEGMRAASRLADVMRASLTGRKCRRWVSARSVGVVRTERCLAARALARPSGEVEALVLVGRSARWMERHRRAPEIEVLARHE